MQSRFKTVSIVIAVFNERKYISEVIRRVKKAKTLNLNKEIIVVDDGSTDGTQKILRQMKGIRLIAKPNNEGKGASLRKGFAIAKGEIVLVQDADLEYDPNDYEALLAPIVKGDAKVVYGSRMLRHGKMRHGGIFFYWGGQFINWLTNQLYQLKLTDEATAYKVFRKDVLDATPLSCRRFEFCPEVTAKLARAGVMITEVPINYRARRVTEGKKINWKDGLHAIWTLVKYKIWPI